MILLSRDDTFARETTEIATQSSSVDIYFVASYNVNFYQQGLDPIDNLGINEATISHRWVTVLRSGASFMRCRSM